MIHLTENAVNAVRSAILRASVPVQGLRIAAESGGCAGLIYKMGLVVDVDPDDAVVESGGVKIFVGRDSIPHLAGTTVDFVTSLQKSGFSFENPQAQSRCSCGRSFG